MLRYKACRNSIVTLELLGNTTTNENRDGVVNDKYAKFRCDKAKVILIVNVKTEETIKKDVSIRNPNFHYRVGEIVKTDFTTNLNAVCTKGIHYFKTKEAAFSWFYRQNDENPPDGKITSWHESGQKSSEGTYKCGKFDGKWIVWYENGQKRCEGTYKNGEKDGKWIYLYDNGQKNTEGTFKYGKRDGKWTYWWKNGNKKSEGTLKGGERIGEWIYWYENGQINER